VLTSATLSHHKWMRDLISHTDFYRELEISLPKSTEEQRRNWAKTIVEHDLDLKELSQLLSCEPKIASRFLWLLSDVAIHGPDKLYAALAFLLKLCKKEHPDYLLSFASYWRMVGVPEENEAEAIDLLFQWLLSADVNVTMKSRSALALFELTKKYPDLKEEFRLCLEDQKRKYSKDFEKRVGKILDNL